MTGRTIFHITQYKAGSQWIQSILLKCASERLIKPKLWATQFVKDPIIPGGIYPAVYVTKRIFDRKRKPENCQQFVVLRDLRDTAVSAYFSLKLSHPPVGDVEKIRRRLNSRDFEDRMLKYWLGHQVEELGLASTIHRNIRFSNRFCYVAGAPAPFPENDAAA